ncbi:MAG: hypothetical protein RDU24_14505 [Humidesulfovibrio sp.]|uniref:hypothetical protein n=1 Tax=Humidesulfovibrio sp. TaxID=2910988 RepID=UPI0027F220C1|nr:hypothetical protein [Humidesulfovibrio sp.]MDQ7836588.1 hypothetical protein [Humidesulfovibrio sp.]MDQ7836590.1 hypothetical protein [Humidesulfovibrio sp.]
MTLSSRAWRWLAHALGVLSLVFLFLLHLRTGYPPEWNKVQVGMAASQLRALCGQPTHSSGMGPDSWEAPFAFGNWVMEVQNGDYETDPSAIIYSVVIVYEHPLAWKDLVLRSVRPPIQDYAAFMRAFGLKPDPNKVYRIVRPPQEP